MKNRKIKIVTGILLFTGLYTHSLAGVNVDIGVGVELNVVDCIESDKCREVLKNTVPLEQVNTLLTEMVQDKIYQNIFGGYKEFNNKSVKKFFTTYEDAFTTLDNQNMKITNILAKMTKQFNANTVIDFEKQKNSFCTDLGKSDTRYLYRNENLSKFIHDYVFLDRKDNNVPVADKIWKLYDKKFNEYITYANRKTKFCSSNFTSLNTFNNENIKLNKRLILITSYIEYTKNPTEKNKKTLSKNYTEYKKVYGEPKISSDAVQEQLDLLLSIGNTKKQFIDLITLYK